MGNERDNWHRVARSRSDLELASLSFALRHGYSHEEFALAIWSRGAERWMDPTPEEYIRKELTSFEWLFPEVEANIVRSSGEEAELVFSLSGCPYGWGKDRWGRARSHGLTPEEVHIYCREGFRIWAAALGLEAGTHPQEDGSCILRAARRR